jgi:hypothetical protein
MTRVFAGYVSKSMAFICLKQMFPAGKSEFQALIIMAGRFWRQKEALKAKNRPIF